MAQRQHAPVRRQWSAGSFLALLVVLTGALLVATCLLPHDRALRFASLTEPAVIKAGWIYQRIHDDPAPIDVAFIGTSRSVFGIDSAAVEAAFRARTGRDLHVVNFAVQNLGRDLHFLLAREAITHRSLKMLVIEVMETEPRDMHPAFGALADPADILGAPMVINPSFLRDLATLPRRQILLAADSIRQRMSSGPAGPDAAGYRGSHWDDTYAELGTPRHPLLPVRPRTHHMEPAQLESLRARRQARIGSKLSLPAAFTALETRASLIYLDRIKALAAAEGVAVRLLYLPAYGASAPPAFAAAYASPIGPIWEPQAILADPGHWLDAVHFNHDGAQALSRWLAGQLAADPALRAGSR